MNMYMHNYAHTPITSTQTNYDYYTEIFKNTFFLLSFLPFVISFSTFVVVHYVWTPYIYKQGYKNIDHYLKAVSTCTWEEEINKPEKTEEELYIEKYKITEDMVHEEKDTYKNDYITEDTPDNKIVMSYDIGDNCYHYWCDKSQIDFKVLDMVARKYVITYKCKNFYINREEHVEEQVKKLEEKKRQIEEQKKMKEEDNDSSEKEESVFVKISLPTNKIRKKNDLMLKILKSNKFIRKGNMREYNELIEKIKNDVSSKTKNISFADFKQKSL